MKFLSFLALPVAAQAINVVISNDDGWAEINIRELYNSLTKAGFKSIISAPAENKSGTGSRDEEPKEVGSSGCEFASCSAGSPPYGRNESMPQFNVSHGRTSGCQRIDVMILVRQLLPCNLHAARNPNPLQHIL